MAPVFFLSFLAGKITNFDVGYPKSKFSQQDNFWKTFNKQDTMI